MSISLAFNRQSIESFMLPTIVSSGRLANASKSRRWLRGLSRRRARFLGRRAKLDRRTRRSREQEVHTCGVEKLVSMTDCDIDNLWTTITHERALATGAKPVVGTLRSNLMIVRFASHHLRIPTASEASNNIDTLAGNYFPSWGGNMVEREND